MTIHRPWLTVLLAIFCSGTYLVPLSFAEDGDKEEKVKWNVETPPSESYQQAIDVEEGLG